MARFAYTLAKDGTKTTYHSELVPSDLRYETFYCLGENYDCPARLHISGRVSSVSYTPRFTALSTYPHRDDCPHRNNHSYYTKRYEADSLDFELLTQTILGAPKQRTIKTGEAPQVRQTSAYKGETKKQALPLKLQAVYRYCAEKHIDSVIGNTQCKVGLFFVDSRSNHIYTKGIFGWKVIECYYHSYSRKLQIIRFKYPLTTSQINRYDIELKVPDTTLFSYLTGKVYGERPLPIAIYANWKMSYGKVVGEIITAEQVYSPPVKNHGVKE